MAFVLGLSGFAGWRAACRRSCLGAGAAAALALVSLAAAAQVSVSSSGLPSYSQPITVPPGVAGMTPQLALAFSGGGINGPQGQGWSLQGVSLVSRCAGALWLDGAPGAVTYSASDRLCLDGQRLVRTDANGTPLASSSDDALGRGAGWAEFRTETDSYARIRAYGTWGSATSNGPKWLRVWTKAGQVFDYGSPDAGPAALVTVEAPGVAEADRPVMVWPVSRVKDTLGNYMDFSYSVRSLAWGSGPTADAPSSAREWNIARIDYSGFAGSPARAPNNRIVFDYDDRGGPAPGRSHDRGEAYQAGHKSVSFARMTRVRSFVGTNLSQPVLVRSLLLGYETSPATGRSRLASIKECFGEEPGSNGTPTDRCTQPTALTYADTGSEGLALSAAFDLDNTKLIDDIGETGVLLGDFNADGRTDLLRWSSASPATLNTVYYSQGDGSFTASAAFNVDDRLFHKDGCFWSVVMDVNADGLPDIVRHAEDKKYDGSACGFGIGNVTHVFRNNGDGTFAPVKLVLQASGADLLLRRTQSRRLAEVCDPFDPPDPRAAAANAPENAYPYCGIGWSAGATFYLVDANGDSWVDVVQTDLSAQPSGWNTQGSPPPGCAVGAVCTRVYLAQPGSLGQFVERANPSVAGKTLYSDPAGSRDASGSLARAVDADGDGLQDLLAGKYGVTLGSVYRSTGSGDFVALLAPGDCVNPIDFNGDQRVDCLRPGVDGPSNALWTSTGKAYTGAANFNIHTAGLLSAESAAPDKRFGNFVFDFNADGRDDILRWHDQQASNLLYLSNGDGTFRLAAYSYTNTQFQDGLGKRQTVFGDFTGQGVGELLRLSSEAPTAAGNQTLTNNLYLRTSPEQPDRLLTVTSPTGLVTRLAYASLPNLAPERYRPDRDTPNAAQYPDIDLMLAMPVVLTVESDSGVGSTTTKTEYAYGGLKVDARGRGLLGFRHLRTQRPGANGQPLTTATDQLTMRPYAGMARYSQTRTASLAGFDAGSVISTTTNTYCDRTSATPPGDATPAAPCATGAKVTRPYLRESVEAGADLDGTALPSVTTTHGFDDYGNPTLITVSTSGSFAGSVRTYTKTTTNSYDNSTSGERWVLGRLRNASVASSVPNLDLNPSAGTAAYASEVNGQNVPALAAPNAQPAQPASQPSGQ